MSSDDDFFVLRRFGELSTRVALYLQDEIVEVGKQLDVEDAAAVAESADSGTFRRDSRPRRKILEHLATLIERYRMKLVLLNLVQVSTSNSSLTQDQRILFSIIRNSNPDQERQIPRSTMSDSG